MKADKPAPANELSTLLQKAPAAADRLSLSGLALAGGAAAALERGALREEARNRARYGEGAPAAVAAAGRLALRRARGVRLHGMARTAELGRSTGRDETVVLGQVRSAAGPALSGVRVTLTNEQGPRSYLGRATTDAGGVFSFRSPRKVFRRFFEGSQNLVLDLAGGPFDVRHTVVRPVGDLDRPLRRIDVTLPAEALQPPAAAPAPPAAARRAAPPRREEATAPAPAKVYLADGAGGGLVERLQRRLAAAGFDSGRPDGDFGPRTHRAVAAFQRDRRLPETGEVDGETWRALFDAEPPGVFERALAVTAAFEGHGFTHAAGNFDGAGLTWGIIGFTLEHGGVGKIVRAVHRDHPEMLAEDFGPQRSQTLLEVLDKPVEEQIAWADGISLTADKARLHKPWTEAFARFGSRPEVQAVQLELAAADYGEPGRRTAEQLGLTSELGVALCLDVQVQNGGVKAAARRQIETARAEAEPAGERELRRIVANAVADHARPRYREDVRARKLTLAEGEGTVHGKRYVLRNWGLDETPA